MLDWGRLARIFPGWTLEDIKSLSPKDRANWFEVAMTTMLGG